MIKKITIAGIELDNGPVRESIVLLDKEMGSQPLFLVEEVTMNMLLLAQNDEKVREAIESASYTVIGEPGVLEAAGEGDTQGKREIENHEFFYELMGRLARSRKRLFLVGDKVAETEQFFQYLQEEFPKCEFVGAAAMEENVGADAVVNEINAASADAVLCILPTPERAYFLLQYRDKISASLWYGMEPDKLQPGRRSPLRWIRKLLHRRRLAEHNEKQER